jgi:F-type H+-transporting ATPase subunit delta
LFETAKAERTIEDTLAQLQHLGGLLRGHADLRAFLWNPDVEPDQKLGVLDKVAPGSAAADAKGGPRAWSTLVRPFLLMVIGLGRAEALPEIVEAFAAAADRDAGRLRVVVRSARPIAEAQLARLKSALEHREGKRIELTTELQPALLGGMQIQLDHRMIDGSVSRALSELRERLRSVKVN